MNSLLVPRLVPLLRSAGAAALAAALVAGCVNYAGIRSDKHVGTPDGYATARSLPAEDGRWPAPDWAKQFGDAQLAQLIDEALAGSPTIAAAQARVAKAAAYAQGAGARTLPNVDARYTLTRERYSANALFPPPFGGGWYTENNALLSASYELNLWGKNRAALDAALSSQQAADAELQQARLTLAASVARTYNELARLDALRDVAQREIAQRRQIGRITEDRVHAGLDTQVERRTADADVATSETERDRLDGQITLVRYQLAALLGKGPDRGLAIAAPTLGDGGDVALPDRLPADLLARRPDLVAARWRVDAAAHDVKVTQAEFYPNVNLAALAGFDAFGFGRFLTPGSRQYQAGPAIHLPIFDAGALRAQLKGNYADFDAAVAHYDRTLVDALNDVATQIAAIHAVDRQYADAQRAYDAAQQAYDLAVVRYRAGLAPQLTVLNADVTLLTQQQTLVNLRMARRDRQIGLAQALGGGFHADGAALPPTHDAAPPQSQLDLQPSHS